MIARQTQKGSLSVHNATTPRKRTGTTTGLDSQKLLLLRHNFLILSRHKHRNNHEIKTKSNMKSACAQTLLVVLLSVFVPLAHADSKVFYNPDRNGPDWPQHCAQRLDWCLVYGGHCGKLAANDFCRLAGYKYASRYSRASGVGRTRTIGDNKQCSGSYCDGFRRIVCRDRSGLQNSNTRTTPVKKFYNPRYLGRSLDWCLVFEKHCGQSAADAYCRMRGYSRAKTYRKRHITNQTEKAKCIGDSRTCDPRHHGCDTFSWIECTKSFCL